MHSYLNYSAFDFDFPEPGVLRLTFNRPEQLNTLDARRREELANVWVHAGNDPNVRSILLRGSGRAFSAGGDLSLIEELIDDPEAQARMFQGARDLVKNIIDCPKPIVSAVHGAAAGAGLAAALLADVSIVAKDATLVDGHTRLGLAAGDHSVALWPLLCGMAKAKYHLLLCEPINGQKAEEMGLVSLAVDAADLDDTSLTVAKRLASGSPTAIQWTKHALNNWLRVAGPSLDASIALLLLGLNGPDIREGIASVRQKRQPDFFGKR